MDNREKLLETALHLFYEKGYDAVGVQEIVQQVGITKPTLYYYFGSKLGLLKSLLEENFGELNQCLRNSIVYEGDIKKALLQVSETFFGCAIHKKEFYLFSLALIYSGRSNIAYKAVRPYMIEQYQIITQIFEKAKKQLGNMNGRQEQFAAGFIGTINQYLLVHFERNQNSQVRITKKEISLLVHQFMHGIYS